MLATPSNPAHAASPMTEPAARPGAFMNIALRVARNSATSAVPASETPINARSAPFAERRATFVTYYRPAIETAAV
jgi:hypothetical protein